MSEAQQMAAEQARRREASAAQERDLIERRQQAKVAIPKKATLGTGAGVRGSTKIPIPAKPPTPPRPRRGAAFKPKTTITDIANTLFKNANLPTFEEQREAIKKMGISAARQQFKPKTAKELKARLGLAVVEPLIGAAQEATLGIGTRTASLGRPETVQLRIIGGVLTPTVADAVVGTVLRKLTISTRARSVLKKIENILTEKGDPLDALKAARSLDLSGKRFLKQMSDNNLIPSNNALGVDFADEVDQLLKLDNPSAKQFERGLTKIRRESDRAIKLDLDARSSKTRINALLKKLEDALSVLQEPLEDPLLTKRRFEEGLTQARRLATTIPDKDKLPLLDPKFPGKVFESGLTADRRNAIRLLDLRNTLNKGTRTADSIKNFIELNTKSRRGFTALVPPDLSKIPNAADDLINFIDENPTVFQDGTLFSWTLLGLSDKDAKKVLEKTTTLPSDKIDDLVEQLRDVTLGQVQDLTPDVFVEDEPEREIPIPIIEPITDVPPIEEPVTDIPTPTVPVPSEQELIEDPPIQEILPTDPVILGKKDIKIRNTLNLRLFRGAKSMFRVTFFFSKSVSEVVPVEARSFPEAVNKAQRSRKRRKKQPRLVDVVKTR